MTLKTSGEQSPPRCEDQQRVPVVLTSTRGSCYCLDLSQQAETKESPRVLDSSWRCSPSLDCHRIAAKGGTCVTALQDPLPAVPSQGFVTEAP